VSDTVLLRIKPVVPEGPAEPVYGSRAAAGMDLAAWLPGGPMKIEAGKSARVPTGWIMEIPGGYEGQVRPRSGLAAKHGIAVLNAPGTIDSDYRGEVQVILINLGNEDFIIKNGDRIAQLVIAPVTRARVETVSELSDTDRGAGGFGSTGR